MKSIKLKESKNQQAENSQNETESQEEETLPTPIPENKEPEPKTKAEIPKGPVKVFPGAEGFGTESPAGRGGKIFKVTNLNDNGMGSLRDAMEASGPRTIVFEVSGTIELSSAIEVSHPNLTVAGQTAPSPGITLKGAGIITEADHILIQHIRIRVGDSAQGPSPGSRDALSILSSNVVIDHVSASWATDEIFSTWYTNDKVTISNSICSEALDDSIHPKGPHSKGGLFVNTKNFTFKRNLLAHNAERNILVGGNLSSIVANNIFYNAYRYFTELSCDPNESMKATIVGNFYMAGPSTIKSEAGGIDYYGGASQNECQFYNRDNVAIDIPLMFNDAKPFEVSAPPVDLKGHTIIQSNDVMQTVFSNVGARPMDRDSVDKRVINDVKNKTGKVIDSQNDVGGWPNLKRNSRTFRVPNTPNGDDNNNGYTNLEEEIYQHTLCVEKGLYCPK